MAVQAIREVGARELRHHTAEIVRSVVDRERIILARHGNPQAVLFSMHDAIELLAESSLPALTDAGARDFRAGQVEVVEPPGPRRLVLARDAATDYLRMNARDRAQLRVALVRGVVDAGELLWLRSRRWLASFSYPDSSTVLVNGLFDVASLERELIGETIWVARARRDVERRLRARD